MSAAAWQALFEALSDIDRLVDEDPIIAAAKEGGLVRPLSALSATPPVPVFGATGEEEAQPLAMAASGGEAAAAEGHPLATLHDRVNRRLDALADELASTLDELVADKIYPPLRIYLDERILDRLPPSLDLEWPALQREMLHAVNGGEVFFDRLDRLLEHTDTPSFVLEFYYFCLESGYQGRLVGQPARIAEERRRLAERFERPPAAPRDDLTPPSPAAPRSPLPYYVATATFIVLLPFLLRYLSNL